MSGPVELLGVIASGLLVLVAIGVSWWAGLHLERDLITAALRAATSPAMTPTAIPAATVHPREVQGTRTSKTQPSACVSS